MSDASLHLIALALFAEINARIDCGESRQLILNEKGLTEPEFQQEQQRWLQLLADQAQQQQWQLQQRYSAVYAQWRFRSNGPESPPQVIRTDTLPFGPPGNQPLFTSGTSPAHTPAAAIGASAPFTLPALEPGGKFGAKPYSPTPSRPTPPYFASPAATSVSPAPISPTPAFTSPSPAFTSPATPAFTSPSPAFTSPATPAFTSPSAVAPLAATRNIPATEAPAPFAPAPFTPAQPTPAVRSPAPHWEEPDSDGPSFFTAEELAARRAAAAHGNAKPRTENTYAEPVFQVPAEQAARRGESGSFFTTAERQAQRTDAPGAAAPPAGGASSSPSSPVIAPVAMGAVSASAAISPAQVSGEPNPQRLGATGYFTATNNPAVQRPEAPPFFTTSTQPIAATPPQRSELERTQAPAFFTSPGHTPAERPSDRAAEPARKEPTGYFTSVGNTTAFRAEAPPFFTTSTQPIVSPTPQRLDGPAQLSGAQLSGTQLPAAQLPQTQTTPAQASHAQPPAAPVSPAYFTSAGQAAAGRPTASAPDAGPNPSPAYFTSAGQAAAHSPTGHTSEPRKEPTGFFTSVGNTTAFRQEAPPFFTTGTQPVVTPTPLRADHPAAPPAPRDAVHGDAPSPAFFTSAGQAAAGRPTVPTPDAAPSPAFFTSAGQAAAGSGAPGPFTQAAAAGPLPHQSFSATPPFSPAIAPPAIGGYAPAQPAPAAMAPATALSTGTSPVQAFSASGYFTNNSPTGAWRVPQPAAPEPQVTGAMVPPPLSFEQLTCLTAEVELNPSNAASAIAGYGIDRQSYQTQLQALRVRCEADAELQQRYDRLIQYYRSVVKQR